MMSRKRALPFFLFGSILFSLGGFAATMRGQTDAPPIAEESPRLPRDRKAQQRLEAAREYVEDRAWPKAVRLLQKLLDVETDSFYREPVRNPGDKTPPRWISIRGEAEKLLADLPPEGKDSYRTTYEPTARKELNAARARHDWPAIHEIARRYRHTDAGIDALQEIALYHLDRGQPELADACFRQLVHSRGAAQLAPRTLFQAVLAARLATRDDFQELPAWRALVERIGDGGLSLGSETYRADKLRELLLRWPDSSSDHSLLYRGDARRSGRGRGEGFLLDPLWRGDTAMGEARQWLAQAQGVLRRPALPAALPLALDGKVIYRGADGLHAVDVRTGRPLWRRPSVLSLSSVLANAGQKVQVRSWLKLYGADRTALVENTAASTLSSDGRRVYALSDLPLPPHPSLLQTPDNPLVTGSLRRLVRSNLLRALDAATGKILWEIGGASVLSRSAPNVWADTHFLGPPLPLARQLFAVVEKERQASLVCLDAQTGRLRWRQPLATARDPLSRNVVRHTQAVHLAFAEGVLVCPTHGGTIVGVDPLTRSLLWVHAYDGKDRNANTPNEGEAGTPSAPLRAAWKNAAPIIHEGRIVFAPPDSEAIHCLRLHDGALLWKAARRAEDCYVAGIHKGGVLVIARGACRMLSLDSGETLWQRPTPAPAGLGVLAGSRYYLPVRGALLVLDLDRPEDSQRLEMRTRRDDLGNLLFHRGVLLSQSAVAIVAWTPVTVQLDRLQRRLNASPGDPSLLFETGRLRLEKGDWSGAVADLRAALSHDPPPALRSAIQERLFAALRQLLQHDFAAGEKYLDDYRALCRVPIPSSVEGRRRTALEQEGRRRQTECGILIAAGRAKQGRTLEAFQVYRELSRRGEQLVSVPDDPALRTRPDLWIGQRVAALLANARPEECRLLVHQLRQEGQSLLRSYDRAAMRGFLALSGSLKDDETLPIVAVRLCLAQQLARTSGGDSALEAELLLHDAHVDRQRRPSRFHAQALGEHALLLTRHGLLEEAIADYRRLARDYADTVVRDGRTGAQLLADLETDKRFLPVLERSGDAPQSLQPLPAPQKRMIRSFHVSCVPCQHLPPRELEAMALKGLLPPKGELPQWCRRLRFTIDGIRLRLQAADRASGRVVFDIPLRLPRIPASLRDREISYQAVDHLLVLRIGPRILAFDLLRQRVRWTRTIANLPHGDVLGPIGPFAVCVRSHNHLIALDPLTGEERWVRDDVGADVSVFGDDDTLFLVRQAGQGSVRGVRAVRTYDGGAISAP
jgi:outer membrane protein assembly factor BamB/tetratricopeptide (TPR) repeat protein